MDNVREQYYKLSINYLSVVGLWPYTATNVRIIKNVIFQILSLIFIIFQLTTFVTIKINSKIILSTLAPVIISMGFYVKHTTFFFQAETIKEITKRIKRDWDAVKCKEELQIISERASTGRYYTKIFALFIYPSAFIIIMSQVQCLIFDIDVPLNESHLCCSLMKLEFFLDEKKNYYLNMFFVDIGAVLGCITYIGTEGILFMWLQHVSALLEITAYRIKQALFENSFQKHDSQRSATMEERLIGAVHMHENAIQFSEYVRVNYAPTYLMMLAFGIVSMSINMFRLSLAFPTELDETLTSAFFIVSEYGYMYYTLSISQQVTDCFADVFHQTYDTNWYEAPVSVQKFLFFIMLRSTKPYVFELFGFCSSSREGFASVTKTSLSFFMVMYSTNKDVSDVSV